MEPWACHVSIDPYTGSFELLPDPEAPPAALVALATTPTREQIERLEGHLVQHDQVEVPEVHRFAEGMYVREITIPADTLMTGAAHLHEHVSIMLRGDMTVLTETGMRRIRGHNVFISPAGTKRVGYAHEETVWLTVHVNADNATDVPQIVSRLIEAPDVQRLQSMAKERLCL